MDECNRQLLFCTGQTWLTKHDVILWVPVHGGLVKVRREDLDIAASAVNLLLMLDGKLDDQGLSLIAEGIKAGRESVKADVLAGLDTWCSKKEKEKKICIRTNI